MARLASKWTQGSSQKQEVPSGAINGVNTVYQTSQTPDVTTVRLFLNGLLLYQGIHYSVDALGEITTFTAPSVGQKIYVIYEY